MQQEGHIVGNHTYTHPDMSKISTKEAFEKELGELSTLYQKTTGEENLSAGILPYVDNKSISD